MKLLFSLPSFYISNSLWWNVHRELAPRKTGLCALTYGVLGPFMILLAMFAMGKGRIAIFIQRWFRPRNTHSSSMLWTLCIYFPSYCTLRPWRKRFAYYTYLKEVFWKRNPQPLEMCLATDAQTHPDGVEGMLSKKRNFYKFCNFIF